MKLKPSYALVAVVLGCGVAQAAEMTIFKQPNFTGGSETLRNESTSLYDSGFQDQVSSIVVRSGRWQVCTQPNFQGDCRVLEPGEYSSLDGSLNHRIESARVMSSNVARSDERHYPQRAGRDAYGSERAYRDPSSQGYREGYRDDNRGDYREENRGDYRGDYRDNGQDSGGYRYGH
jgi:hypothetical protein